MTLSASYPWEYIKSLSADDFVEILINGKEKIEEDKLFFRWCLLEVHNFGEPINFREYKEQMTWHPQPSTKDILKEQDELIALFNKKMKKVDFYGNI